MRRPSKAQKTAALIIWIIAILLLTKATLAYTKEEKEPVTHRIVVEKRTYNEPRIINECETGIQLSEDIYTIDELELVYAIVWAESGNDYFNMVYTAEAIFNRVNSKYFPDSIHDVVYQGNGSQFNGVWRDNFGYYTEETIEAVKHAMEDPMFAGDMVYFANTSISTDSRFINNVIVPNQVATLAGHTFAIDTRGW